MPKLSNLLLVGAIIVIFCADMLAQKKGAAAPEKVGVKKATPAPRVQAHLGHSRYAGGPIKKDEFVTLMKQGVTAQDSAGNPYRVLGFRLGWAERKYYEDSEATLTLMTDYSSENYIGDTLPSTVGATFYPAVKGGDTVYIEKVTVAKMNARIAADTTMGKGMKCVIMK